MQQYTRQQIEQISARQIVQKRRERLFTEGSNHAMIPSYSDLRRGAKQYTVTVRNFQGRAHIIANNDFSTAGTFDSFVSERTQTIEMLAAKYGLTFTEEIHADYAQMDLKGDQIALALEAIYNRQDDLGYYGALANNLYGFSNQPNVHNFTLVADGAGASPFWDDKTPEQILRDMQQILYSAARRTQFAYHTTHIAIPQSVWEVLNFTILAGLNSTSTILSALITNQQILGNGHGTVKFVIAPGLETAGPGGTPMMVAFNPAEDNMGILETPGIDARGPFETLVGNEGLFYKYVGGIALLQPLSMVYVKNIFS
jgi:hypothetical protein